MLFRTPHIDRPRKEDGTLKGVLRGAELELALIELIDDLAHGDLIELG